MVPTPTNRLIQSLPAAQRRSLSTDLQRMEIDTRECLTVPGTSLAHVYFPTGAVISALYTSGRGSVEVHGTGREGMIGPEFLFAAADSRFALTCQIAGTLLYMPTARFDRHTRSTPALRRIRLQYARSVMTELTQSVACNGLHSIAQRCARWLLATSDRVGGTTFALTHELLARMLGVRRSGVSLAVYQLQRRGIIRYRAGRIELLDTARLQAESCECYGVVVRDRRRIFSRASSAATAP